MFLLKRTYSLSMNGPNQNILLLSKNSFSLFSIIFQGFVQWTMSKIEAKKITSSSQSLRKNPAFPQNLKSLRKPINLWTVSNWKTNCLWSFILNGFVWVDEMFLFLTRRWKIKFFLHFRNKSLKINLLFCVDNFKSSEIVLNWHFFIKCYVGICHWIRSF